MGARCGIRSFRRFCKGEVEGPSVGGGRVDVEDETIIFLVIGFMLPCRCSFRETCPAVIMTNSFYRHLVLTMLPSSLVGMQ